MAHFHCYMFTAADYHTRYLKLARKLGDQNGEARAYATLACDYRKQNMPEKAIYFLGLQAILAMQVHFLLWTKLEKS